nr:hypothetical protein [uncultured Paenibacillus sp.]
MGEDHVFLVSGGQAHIGAIATACPSGEPAAKTGLLSFPGHREAELALELAEMASIALGRTVAVVAGIHLDNPSKRDIEDIVLEAKREMRRVLEELRLGA